MKFLVWVLLLVPALSAVPPHPAHIFGLVTGPQCGSAYVEFPDPTVVDNPISGCTNDTVKGWAGWVQVLDVCKMTGLFVHTLSNDSQVVNVTTFDVCGQVLVSTRPAAVNAALFRNAEKDLGMAWIYSAFTTRPLIYSVDLTTGVHVGDDILLEGLPGNAFQSFATVDVSSHMLYAVTWSDIDEDPVVFAVDLVKRVQVGGVVPIISSGAVDGILFDAISKRLIVHITFVGDKAQYAVLDAELGNTTTLAASRVNLVVSQWGAAVTRSVGWTGLCGLVSSSAGTYTCEYLYPATGAVVHWNTGTDVRVAVLAGVSPV